MRPIEKIANNMLTIVIARFAMIVTPPSIGMISWLGMHTYQNIELRISELERLRLLQTSELQDHTSRLDNDKQAVETLRIYTNTQFDKMGDTLDGVQKELNEMNGSIIRLQTTLENRLPARTGMLESPR